MVHVMSEVKPVHRYKAQTLFSFGGAKIEYFPHGPDVVFATEFDAQRLRADTAEAELADMQHWRDLALQFDNHRMTALGHLRAVVRCSDRDLLADAEEFLKSPPLSASEVVAKLAAAEQRIASHESTLRHFANCADVRQVGTSAMAYAAALNPNPEAESHE